MHSLTFLTSLLENCGVRPSPVRHLVLKTLCDAEHPLSSSEIEKRLETVDRSSITRTLVLFVNRGVVHSFEDGSGSMKYEICKAQGSHNHNHSNSSRAIPSDYHPHFHCQKCGETICLENISIPHVPLPEGFTSLSASLIIKGLCAKCQSPK